MPSDGMSNTERWYNQLVGDEFAKRYREKAEAAQKAKLEREASITISDEEKKQLRDLGYSVTESANGFSPHLLYDPMFNIRGWCATENGAWKLCKENAEYRQRDKEWRSRYER